MAMTGLLIILLGGNFFPQLLESPPRDLVSLVDPKVVLEKEGLKTDGASLIALLEGKVEVNLGEADLKKAIADLASDEFRTREHARQVLEAAGQDAYPYLNEAARSEHPEVRLSAKEIIAAVNANEDANQSIEDACNTAKSNIHVNAIQIAMATNKPEAVWRFELGANFAVPPVCR